MKRIIASIVLVTALVGCSNGHDHHDHDHEEHDHEGHEDHGDEEASGYTYCGISGPGISEDAPFHEQAVNESYCESFALVYNDPQVTPGSDMCAAASLLDREALRATYMSPDGGDYSFSNAAGLVDGLWAAC